MYKVRKTQDIDTVKLLHNKILPTDEYQESDVLWLLYFNNEPVGFCGVKNLKHNICYFSIAGILPQHRGKGLHKRLISVRKRYAKASGALCLITYTIISNPCSYNNLQNSGFKLYEPEYKYHGDNCLYWIIEF